MSKTGLIIQREYLTRVKKRSFIVMTFLGPLLFAGLMGAAIWAGSVDDTSHQVLVVDMAGLVSVYDENSSELGPRFEEHFKSNDKLRYSFSAERPDDKAFIEGPYTLMLVFDDGIMQNKSAELYYKKVPSVQVSGAITRQLENAVEQIKVNKNLALSYEEYKRLKTPVQLVQKDIERQDEKSLKQEQAAIGMIFSIIIFFFIFMHGAQVMRGVIEEKSNRIVEVIVSSVRPFELMMGKIAGIGLVGLTQFLMWIVLTFVILSVGEAVFNAGYLNPSAIVESQQLSEVQQEQPDFYQTLAQNEAFDLLFRINWPLMIILFMFYFVGGYLLYGSLFAAVGAAVDSETDTQQFMTPIMLPLFFAYLVAIMSVNNPEGTAATIFSIVPFTSPTVMLVRASMGIDGSMIWQLILSMVLLIGMFLLTTWLAARIYRVGILMYGKKPTWKELGKWVFYKG